MFSLRHLWILFHIINHFEYHYYLSQIHDEIPQPIFLTSAQLSKLYFTSQKGSPQFCATLSFMQLRKMENAEKEEFKQRLFYYCFAKFNPSHWHIFCQIFNCSKRFWFLFPSGSSHYISCTLKCQSEYVSRFHTSNNKMYFYVR